MRRALPLVLVLAAACGGTKVQRAAVVASAPAGPRPLEIHPTASRYRVDAKRSRFEIYGTDVFGSEHRMTFKSWDAHVTLAPTPRITAKIETESVVVDFPGATGAVQKHVLECAKFPVATLDASLARTDGPPAEHVVEGVAELHGVKKTLRFLGTLTEEGDAYRFETSFVVSRKEFDIHYAPMEPFLRDDVRIVVNAVARPERVTAEEAE